MESHGEPWRRHWTTELQLNSPIEGVSVLPATTATKSASAKLRTSHSPGPGLDAVPSPQAPNSVLGSSTTPEVPGCPRVSPQAQGPPEPAPAFPHLRLHFPTPGMVPCFFQDSPAPAPVTVWDKRCQIPQVPPPQEAGPSSREDSGPL